MVLIARSAFVLIAIATSAAWADFTAESNGARAAWTARQKCESEMSQAGCDQLTKADKDVAQYLRKCDGPDSSLGDDGGAIVWSCVKLLPQPPLDALHALARAARRNVQQHNKDIQDCDKKTDCKFTIAQSLPEYKTLTREQVAKMPAALFWVTMENDRTTDDRLSVEERTQRKSIDAFQTPIQDKDAKGANRVSLPYFDKLACLNEQGRLLTRCYTFFEAADVALAVALARTYPSLLQAWRGVSSAEEAAAGEPAESAVAKSVPKAVVSKSVQQQTREAFLGLPDEEKKAINAFKGDGARFNENLRAGKSPSDPFCSPYLHFPKICEQLLNALAKLPDFKGLVYRNTTLRNAEALKPGDLLPDDKGIGAFSEHAGPALDRGGKDFLVVRSLHGKLIDIAEQGRLDENEVDFLPNPKMRVTSVRVLTEPMELDGKILRKGMRLIYADELP